jgi:serine/threonine protein kinase
MARLISPPGNEGPANEGERRVVAQLVGELPADWVVIPNIEIAESGRPAFEYDAVVVTSHAVYVVEIKNRRGSISGDIREWLVNGRTERSPLLTAGHKARVLKSKLVDYAQGLSRVWVDSVVILASQPAKLDLTSDARFRVRLITEAAAFLADSSLVRQRPGAIANLIPTVVHAIIGRAGPRSRLLRFGPYLVVETLEQGSQEVAYRARHVDMPNAPEVRLRVVSLSPYMMSEEQRAARKAQIVRDAESLARMGSHPNVVAARDCFLENDQMVVVLPLVEGRSLRQRLRLGTPLTIEERLRILADLGRGLGHAHSHQVIHRNVTPENVLLEDDGTARLAHFSLAKIEGGSGPTVWVGDAVTDLDPQYLAPELRDPSLGPPSPSTDLFSLGCIAWELFAGAPPFSDPSQAFAALSAFLPGLPGPMQELVRGLLHGDPLARPQSAFEVLALIEQSLGTGAIPPAATGPKFRYDPGDMIDGKFEVRERLGGGGFSDVYRVYWAMGDCERAVKVFNGKSGDDFKSVQREVSVLVKINHPNVVRVFDADQTQTGQWYLVTEFIDGEPASDYVDGSKWLGAEQAVGVGLDLLRALEATHPDEARIAQLKALNELSQEEFEELQELQAHGVVHRDVKPHNIMLTESGAILIDFNIASPAGSSADTQASTPPYRAPDAAHPTTWTVAVDLFAAGVTLYELLCGKHPYEDGVPRLDRRPIDPRAFRGELSHPLAAFLLKSCAPTAGERFATAVEMRAALESIGRLAEERSFRADAAQLAPELMELLAAAPPNVNPMVTEFLALGSQARRSNRDTRGLTRLAQATYVPTRLDDELTGLLLEGKHRLVLITGNAGDGKTAFIQQVEQLARQRNAEVVEQTANGSRLRYLTRDVITLYDGSQDEDDHTSDDILSRFLSPFAAGGGDDGAVRVAAINEGRLRDFLLVHRKEFPELRQVISILDDPSGRAELDGIVVVNLNLRSISAGGAESIFSRQVRAIVNGPFWMPCERCDYRLRCPIKHNVDTLGDPLSGGAVTERLRLLVDLVRLRRRRHLTMRDIRSLIAHVLFRDRDCYEVAELLDTGTPMDIADLTYFQAIGGAGVAAGSELDRGASLLAEIDVGIVANPEDDRRMAAGSLPLRLAFTRRESEYPVELLAKARMDAGMGYEGDRVASRRAHQGQRRLTFFERSDSEWWSMLPYTQLRKLEEALGEDAHDARTALRTVVIEAISASEGMHDQADALWLTSSDNDGQTTLRGYRRFPMNEFELVPAGAHVPYVEFEPDHLELRHLLSEASLVVDVDLLEVLDRLIEGAVPSIDESRGILVNLALFKHRLLAAPATELHLVGEMGAVKIAVNAPGRIALMEESP